MGMTPSSYYNNKREQATFFTWETQIVYEMQPLP